MAKVHWPEARTSSSSRLELENGSRVAVIGGGPAGSFFSYFLLNLSERVGLDLQIDIYEPRDFTEPAPKGCNMCGGIVSESLVQHLAMEGINLPPNVVQRGIDSYVLHMDVGSVLIDTPLHEMRIGSVYRGPGPRDIQEIKWGSFDGFLQNLARDRGARIIHDRVDEVGWEDGRPRVKPRGGEAVVYDLAVGAAGINAGMKLFQGWGLEYTPPETAKTFIREYFMGEENIGKTLGNSMHVFLPNLEGLEFGAIIPKGDYATLCLLGEKIDNDLIQKFIESPEVAAVLPTGDSMLKGSCQCSPRISIGPAKMPFTDRVAFIGDCGVTRLFKDGIGSAYRTSKACATAVVFHGISADSFREHYWPACRSIEADNGIGKIMFAFTRVLQKRRIARRAVLRMTEREQDKAGPKRRMSAVLWDLFTGSAPYKDIFSRTLHPAFLGRLSMDYVHSTLTPRKNNGGRKAQ